MLIEAEGRPGVYLNKVLNRLKKTDADYLNKVMKRLKRRLRVRVNNRCGVEIQKPISKE